MTAARPDKQNAFGQPPPTVRSGFGGVTKDHTEQRQLRVHHALKIYSSGISHIVRRGGLDILSLQQCPDCGSSSRQPLDSSDGA